MNHRFEMSVRWSDLDPYRHLNHAMFFTYCEAARVALLEDVGFSMAKLAELERQVVVVGANAKFLKPALEGMTLTIETSHHSVTRATMVWTQKVLFESQELFTMNVTFAFTDLNGRAVRRPEGFLEAVRG